MSKHMEFIFTPISSILDNAVSASAGIGTSIETYPLCDYIMQSIFLKMTGFQEQKLKCIAWEMATNDYEYRRRLLNNDDQLGEYSTYKAKNAVYRSLIELIEKSNQSFSINQYIDKSSIISNTLDNIKNTFSDSILSKWDQRGFDYICSDRTVIRTSQLLSNDGKNMFESELKSKYEILYKHRNRLAHNTLSYQQNLPTLKTLVAEDDDSRNYYVWFSILALIDNIFIELYKIYQEGLETVV